LSFCLLYFPNEKKKELHKPSLETYPPRDLGANRPHDHTIPNLNLFIGPLMDECDRGTLWDPVLSAYKYVFDRTTRHFAPADGGSDPVGFLRFNGRWGDQQYPPSDRRQRLILGIPGTAKFQNGPAGPAHKQLDRQKVCLDNGQPCIVWPIRRP
jgi:hypothetical protein